MPVRFEEVQTITRTRQVVETFRKAIIDGSLRIGEKPTPERELCRQLGVSRTSLREAVRVLSAFGLVESTEGGGTFVTDRFSESVFDFLGFGAALDRKNFAHLFQMREVIETGAVEIAAQTISPMELFVLEGLVASLTREGDHSRLGELDAAFHEALVELTRNPILVAFYRMIYKMLLAATSNLIVLPNAKDVARRHHAGIVKALRAGNARECRRLVKAHLSASKSLLERHFYKEA